MSTMLHIAQKYEVEFIDCPHTIDEFGGLMDRLQEHGIVAWNNNDDDIELNRAELGGLLASGDLADDDELRRFIDFMLSNGDPNIDYIKLQLY